MKHHRRFNKELQWLAETFGIDIKPLATNGHLSGAIFGRISSIVDSWIPSIKPGELFYTITNVEIGSVTISTGCTVQFVRFDKRMKKVVISCLNKNFKISQWDFIRQFRSKQ